MLMRKLRVAARDKELKERALNKKLQVQPGEGGERMEDGRLELIEAARKQLGITVEEIVESDGRCLDEGAGKGEERGYGMVSVGGTQNVWEILLDTCRCIEVLVDKYV